MLAYENPRCFVRLRVLSLFNFLSVGVKRCVICRLRVFTMLYLILAVAKFPQLQPRGQAPRPFKPEPQRRHSQPQPAPYFALQRPGNPAPYPLQPRESPMGQSSSTQGQTSDSSYMSSQSGLTAAATFRPEGGRGKGGVGAEEGGEEEEEEEDREVRTLGPAGRYPDSTEGRPPSGARLTPQTVKVSRWIPFFPVARGFFVILPYPLREFRVGLPR